MGWTFYHTPLDFELVVIKIRELDFELVIIKNTR